MRLITRYVLFEVGAIFIATLLILTGIMIGFGVGKEALQQGLGVKHVVQLVPYVLPNALLFAIPGTILFAVTHVYGRMSDNNEIVALKSLGISPTVIIGPALCLAVALSLVTVWLNDVAMSWGYQGIQRVVLNGVEDIAYGLLRSQKSFGNKQFSVSVKRVEGRRLVLPTITVHLRGGAPEITITAEEAELRSNPGSGVLTISCTHGRIDAGGTVFSFADDTYEQEIPLQGDESISASHTPLRELPGLIAQLEFDIEKQMQASAANAAYAMMTGEFASLSNPAWSRGAENIAAIARQINRLRTESPRRWANGFSCLFFALVGAPVAILFKKSGVLASFFLCFLPILLVYYPLLAMGVDRAKAGSWPPYSVWCANGVLAVCAYWLLRRTYRY